MKKISKNYFIAVLILTLLPVLSYSQIKIKGQILNSENKPVEFVEVLLCSSDSIVIKSEFSDENGNFTIETNIGNYRLKISQLGKIMFERNIELSKDLNLETIKVNTTNQLQTVVVKNKKKLIERKVDRLVFNVENSISAIGGDATDALKVTPGLRIEEDQISMIGKSGMSVMIDDKLIKLSGDDLISFLKGIPSGNIKSIEVISNPPAKYDAEGNSGIVNIRLKKAKTNSISGNLKTSYSQAKYPLGTLGGGLNYQKDKLTVTSNINYNNGSTAPYQEYTIFYPKYTWFETNKVRSFQNNLSGGVTLDYQINSKTTMGLQYSGASNKPIRKGLNTSNITNNNFVLDSLIVTPSRLEIERNTQSVNFHIVTKIDSTGQKLSADVDYFKYTSDLNNKFSSNTFLPNGNKVPNRYIAANNLSNQDIDIYSAKVDYDLPLKWADLSFGGKVSFIDNSSTVSYFNTANPDPIYDPSKSNIFDYTENTQAVYISGSKSLSKKWDVQLGLRLENTQTKGFSETLNQTNENDYLKLFPTLYLTYKSSENSTFGFNYNRRIDRPGFSKLNPFRFYTSSFNYTEGNPFLQPYFTDNIEFSNTYKNLYSSVYAYYLKNGFDEVAFVSAGSITQIVRPINFYTEKSIGWVESYTFNKWKWWESNNQLNVYYSQTTSDIPNVLPNIESWTCSFNSTNVFTLNKAKTIKSELNFTGKTPATAGSYRTSGFYYFDMGFSFLFLKNKLQTSVNFLDLFRTQKKTFTQNVNGIKQENYDYRDTQKVRISLVWNFGKSLKTPKKKLSNEEEKKRTN
ncbi:TonB-dependent receptor [Flavobacterium cupreum]|uniref:TonB-dependent receptor n=1 Tax=Flavobacterium cupreum TaxID=2133766 RepID=A0A434A1X2_9FLAO|nr:TonB-dependent receptor [Flavobacterium cupreum]RUT68373.1 TonB-dependent receptor [Flavobacterium cupreum]